VVLPGPWQDSSGNDSFAAPREMPTTLSSETAGESRRLTCKVVLPSPWQDGAGADSFRGPRRTAKRRSLPPLQLL
jgi:hypothetical protein